MIAHMPTLNDIAKIAGVNVSTVSKAINGSKEISKETADRVIRIAQELNYKSNKSTSVLSGKGSNIVGIISPEICSSYYTVIVGEAQKLLYKNGYSMLAAFSDFDANNEIKLLHIMMGKRLDGIILIRAFTENKTEELDELSNKNNIPIVQIAHSFANSYDGFTIDDEYGVSLAVEHLISLGHKKIGFVGDKLSISRMKYYRRCMEQAGLPCDDRMIKVGEERFEQGGYLRMNELLDTGAVPTAVVASYDNIAIGAIYAARERGFLVPEDISFTGIDDVNSARFLKKPLTTVTVPVDELGQFAAKKLLKKMNGETEAAIQHVVLKPKLIIRDTTAQIKQH